MSNVHMLRRDLTLFHGDMRDVLRVLPDNFVDTVVTDPPYHLTSVVKRFGADDAAPARSNGPTGVYARSSAGFMGKRWDGGDIAFQPDTWREIFRVLKPGGHLLAMGGTRTYHRLACAIEDAGFEVRDMVAYLYGTGFPKSHDISKAIDREAGAVGTFGEPRSAAHAAMLKAGTARRGEKHDGWNRPWMDDPEKIDSAQRKYIPATDAAREWQGWGTALKPAIEPTCLARKPLSEATVAANVLRWSTGALNISGARVHPDTMGRLLSHVKQILSRAASEFGNNTFCTSLSLDDGMFASRLGKLLSVEASALLAGEHEFLNGSNGRSPPNSTDRCPVCHHFGDGLALLALMTDRPLPLQLICVRIHNRPSKPADDQVGGQLDSLLYECMNHLASLDCVVEFDCEKRFRFEALHYAVSRYLELCLNCTGTLPRGQSNVGLVDKVARWLVLGSEKNALVDDGLGAGWPFDHLVFNILFGPYLITNTAGLLIKIIEGMGRWPANVIHDGSVDVLEAFPVTAPAKSGGRSTGRNFGQDANDNFSKDRPRTGHEDAGGSAARFFYAAKASKAERAGSKHPTVKPIALMAYFIRLITPPGGIVLDPFAGTGTTGAAALQEGKRCLLIEREDEYAADIQRRFTVDSP